MALDESDLYACYRRMEKPLYNVLYRWLWQVQECQDVIHDAFLRAWDRRHALDAHRLDAWLWTTALNLARNRLRWRRLWRLRDADAREIPGDDGGDAAHGDGNPLEAAERSERDRRLRAALDALPRAMRQVLLLAEFGGLSMQQIADLLGIPPGTVGSRKHVAMTRLRAALQEDPA